MGRLGLALKILFNGSAARLAADALSGASAESTDSTRNIEAAASSAPEPPVEKPARREAVTVLAALQREARFVDFVLEPIDAYSDAQVGAAVREVHRGCSEVITRMFAPQAILDQAEGSQAEIPNAASGLYRLTGNVTQASGAVAGQVAHHGWKAQKCDVPDWSGDDDAVAVVAPAEIQIS